MAISKFSVQMFVLHGCNLLVTCSFKNSNTQNYRVYFPSDKETLCISLSDDEDLERAFGY